MNSTQYVTQTFCWRIWQGFILARYLMQHKTVWRYGCGPSVGLSISAAPKASELILAEYAEQNRKYLKKWLDKDPSVYSWSPHFKYVVQTLEGGSEENAVKCEDMLCNKVKAVVSCDITKEEFIERAYCNKNSYDIIMSSVSGSWMQGPHLLWAWHKKASLTD